MNWSKILRKLRGEPEIDWEELGLPNYDEWDDPVDPDEPLPCSNDNCDREVETYARHIEYGNYPVPACENCAMAISAGDVSVTLPSGRPLE